MTRCYAMTNDETPPAPSPDLPAAPPPTAPEPSPSKLLAYLRLFRLPNVFTAIADVIMGLVFANSTSASRWAMSASVVRE